MPLIQFWRQAMKATGRDLVISTIVGTMDDLKAEDICLLDLREIENCVTSCFIICSGNSNTQVSAICGAISKKLSKELKEKPLHVEGEQEAEWILMDYADIVVHIFQKSTRTYYDIEGLWADAPITKF